MTAMRVVRWPHFRHRWRSKTARTSAARSQVAGTACAALAALSLCGLAAAQDVHWQARLATVPIDAATAGAVTGRGHAEARLRGRKLRVRGVFSGLQGAATVARLREGPYTGVRGKAIADLSITSQSAGALSGTVELTAEQVAALRAGRLYIEIRSKSAPQGNLWGWLLP